MSQAIDTKLAKCLGEFPLTYAAPILIADLSSGGPLFNSGTATLIELESKKVAITCAHVLQKYRENWQMERKSICQIQGVKLEPLSQLIDENLESDLATISLTDNQADLLKQNGKGFFVPATWPPDDATAEDWIGVAGFPGSWREQVDWQTLDFKGYSIGCTPVSSVSEMQIGCRFERERWQWGYKIDDLPDPKNLGGMSGGPGFIIRTLHFEFAGIVREFCPSLDIMYLRPAKMIRLDGSIVDIH